MNLYLLTQNKNNGYDTYDSMVIAAENEEDAKYLSFVKCYALTDRHENEYTSKEPIWRNYYQHTGYYAYDSWAENPIIELIAENALVDEGIVCTSFNAG